MDDSESKGPYQRVVPKGNENHEHQLRVHQVGLEENVPGTTAIGELRNVNPTKISQVAERADLEKAPTEPQLPSLRRLLLHSTGDQCDF